MCAFCKDTLTSCRHEPQQPSEFHWYKLNLAATGLFGYSCFARTTPLSEVPHGKPAGRAGWFTSLWLHRAHSTHVHEVGGSAA